MTLSSREVRTPLLRKPHPRGFQSPNPARSVSVRLTYPDASALARELGAASRARREHCSPYRFWGSPWAEIAPSRCRAVIKAAEGGGSEGVSKGRERVRGRGHAYSSSTALRAVMKIKSPGHFCPCLQYTGRVAYCQARGCPGPLSRA